MFWDSVLINGKSRKAIFDQGSKPHGSKTTRIIRGTEISNLKPMIICDFELHYGEMVEVRGKSYRIKEVEESACGFWTGFLERKHEDRSNYLSEEADSKNS
jgi:hypothetical protein